MDNRKFRIFISHAWGNLGEGHLFTFINEWEDRHELWLDTHKIKPGDVVRQKILQGIEWADVVVLLWSKEVIELDGTNDIQIRKDIQFEIETALSLQKPLIPCLLDEVAATKRNIELLNRLNKEGQALLFIDFFSRAKGIQNGMLRLNQQLLELEFRLLETFIDDPSGMASLRNDMDALSDLMARLQFIMARMKEGHSGNEASNAALQSVLRLAARIFALQGTNGDGNTDKLAQFTKAVQLISAKYPSPADDRLKKELTRAAIEQIDPGGTHERLQQLRYALQSLLASESGLEWADIS